ncbi:MAG: CBS domain-containing protein [Candidatus Aquicultor sp.]|nr:CBS domain-containing protein [Candidatus Aquicultor sp.]
MVQLKTEVKDIMTKEVVTFTPDLPVKEAAKELSEANIGGAPVLDDEGRIIGIVVESDLIMQEVRLHFPTYVQLLDGYIYLPGSMSRFEKEFKKAVGAKVKDVMSTDVVTIDASATVQDAATMLVDKDINMLPVMAEGELVGVVSKRDLVKAIGRS